MNNNIHLLKKTMNVYWLRPESALLRAIELIKLKPYKFTKPILDLGCGDGVFSFLAAGGDFGINFDVFRSVKGSEAFSNGEDIYNYCDESSIVSIVSDVIALPEYKIDVGLDKNEGSLKKASYLSLYNELVNYDANLPLPFADERFNTIFSNAVYHVKRLEELLSELRRIVSARGQITLMLPNDIAKDYLFDIDWVRKVGKWRYSHLATHGHNYEDWKQIFDKCGLNIISHKTHWTKATIQFWDIGLRPISPQLIKMANSLTNEKRAEIKNEWIETLVDLMTPLYTNQSDDKHPLAFHLFQLVKY